MNVVVFKKQDEDDKYLKKLLENHYKPTFIPVLQHQLDNLDTIKSILYNGPTKEGFTGLILTSQRSVEAIEACIKEPFQSSVSEEWNNLPIYIVGSQTAKALSNTPLFEDSHAHWIIEPKALDLIEHFSTDNRQRFLFLAGDKRRDVIPQALDKLDLQYTEIQSYSTCMHTDLKSNLQQFYQQPLDWIVLFSPSGLQFILTAIQDNTELHNFYLKNIHIASIGPTTTEFIEQQRISALSIVTAEKPDAEHLLDAMTRK